MRQKTLEEIECVWMRGYSGRDDTPRASKTKATGDNASDREILNRALAIVRAAGFRVSKPRAPKHKNHVSPTFEARFSDGTQTRMTTFTSLDQLDWQRGVRLSQAAYASRFKGRLPPPIITGRFEQHGNMLATYDRPEVEGDPLKTDTKRKRGRRPRPAPLLDEQPQFDK